MATRLKNLKIKRVALVDEGANPDAHIRFAKSKDGELPPDEADEMTADEAQSLMKRFFSAIAKVFGGSDEGEDVEKGAHTFGETEARRNYDIIMEREVWPMIYAMSDSARSILFDKDKSDSEKESLLKQSVSEFATAFTTASGMWAKAKEAGTDVSKSAESLVRMRDDLNLAIAKAIETAETPAENKPNEPDGDSEPADETTVTGGDPVQKGVTNMIFDTEKMTPEEKAQYDELAKRYGHDETPANDPAPATAPAAAPEEPAVDDDMYKGMHPAVKAELENLRKFREESELKQYTEIAKKYSLLGKKPEELAPVLKSLKDAGGDAYDTMIAMLDSNLAAVEASGTFSEIGKRGTSDDSSEGAWAKIEAAAQEIIKSKPGLRWADAVDQACIAHPELVEAYEKSRR